MTNDQYKSYPLRIQPKHLHITHFFYIRASKSEPEAKLLLISKPIVTLLRGQANFLCVNKVNKRPIYDQQKIVLKNNEIVENIGPKSRLGIFYKSVLIFVKAYITQRPVARGLLIMTVAIHLQMPLINTFIINIVG